MEQTTNKYPVSFNGSGGEFFRIWIVNLLLSVVTLGIYSAWAKVRTKKYFYGNTEIDGYSFDYHANPVQILKGRIIATICILIWVVTSQFFPVVNAFLALAFFFTVPVLVRNNTRFDAVMTSYRNVRFSFDGSLKDAYIAYVGRPVFFGIMIVILFSSVAGFFEANAIVGVIFLIICAAVLLFLYAWVMEGITRYHADNHKYGEHEFSAQFTKAFFFRTYLIALVVAVVIAALLGGIAFAAVAGDFQSMMSGSFEESSSAPVLFIMLYAGFFILGLVTSALIRVRVRNYVFANTAIGLTTEEDDAEHKVELESAMKLGSYLWLVISNFFAQVFTVGLARPWVKVRTQNYLAGVTCIYGDLNKLSASDQEPEVNSAVADEIAEAFDLGLGL